MRWTGHTDNPISGLQPKTGWLPLGAIGWFERGRLEIEGFEGVTKDTTGKTLPVGVPYNFKMRVETLSGQGSLYSLKVWEEGAI